MRILITGDGGFIGRHLLYGLAAQGHQVLGLSALHQQTGRPRPRFGDLLRTVLEECRAEVVIHCAFVRHDPSGNINKQGTRVWAEACRRAGISRQIFISSLSATTASPYGRSKADLESFFCELGGVSLRLGLVMGDGGVFATLCHLLRRFHVFPLLSGGSTPVFPFFVNHLAEVIALILPDYPVYTGRVESLYEPVELSMKELLARLAQEMGVSFWGIPCPFWALSIPVGFLEKMLGPRAPITRDNLLGLRGGERPKQDSLLVRLLPERLTLNDQISTAVAGIKRMEA